jgi:hypothetical protein
MLSASTSWRSRSRTSEWSQAPSRARWPYVLIHDHHFQGVLAPGCHLEPRSAIARISRVEFSFLERLQVAIDLFDEIGELGQDTAPLRTARCAEPRPKII